MVNLCNVDGVITAEADARIPLMDRGFLFGDSIYEVVRATAGVPFAWARHFDRLRTSALGMRLALDLDDAALARRIAATLAASGIADAYVRVIVTRGVGSAPSIDLACATGRPCWIVMVRPAPGAPGQTTRLAIVERLRNDRRALDPAVKSGNYLNSVLGLAEAKQLGATDCLMVNAAGWLTEASTSNLFALIDGVWCTPRLDDGILAGVTRALLLEFLPRCGERVAERHLAVADLQRADEVFLSSTLRDIGPVTHIDGRALHGGETGPRCRHLMAAFAAHRAALLAEVDEPGWRKLLAAGT